MKILYFHQHFSTPKGSTGIRSYQMARKLIDKGHQVTIVCGSYQGGNTGLTGCFENGQRSGYVDGIEIIEFEVNYSNSQSFAQRTFAFLKFANQSVKVALKKDYDLIFATTTPLTAALPGIIARWVRKKVFVFEVRDLWPELPKAMGVINNPFILFLMAVLEKAAYKSAHGHIALSSGISDGIKKHIPNHSNVAIIPNGCDINIFGGNDSWQPEEIADDDFVALFSGTHGIANGLDQLIETAIKLKEYKADKIKIVMIGDGKLKAQLIEKAKDLGLDNIVFLSPVDKTKLALLMKRANVGLQTLANIPAFYYGTSPNKFFDYISAGLPVVNNYPGWLAELINDHDCGRAIPPQNPELFATTLIELANKPEHLNQMALNARKLAEDSFDRNELSEQFVHYLERSYKHVKETV